MRFINVCIWRLEKTVDNILPLFQHDYYRYIDTLIPLNIPESDKKLFYKWMSIPGDGFNEKTHRIGNTDLKYVKSLASLELSALPRENIIVPGTEQPLPKEVRVTKATSSVLFVKQENFSYSIVYGTRSLEPKIRGNLMDCSKKRAESRWGEVFCNEIPEFLSQKSFYYWMLSKKGEDIGDENKRMQIIDVRGFKSNTDRNTHSYSGKGSNIDNEIPLRSIICMDEKLLSLYVTIVYNRITYSFYLDYDGRIEINKPECGEHGTETPRDIDTDKLILDIYFDIFPFLKTNFNTACANNWADTEKSFKKTSAIAVIKEMMEQNGITQSDIIA